jgi:hypothetical protein
LAADVVQLAVARNERYSELAALLTSLVRRVVPTPGPVVAHDTTFLDTQVALVELLQPLVDVTADLGRWHLDEERYPFSSPSGQAERPPRGRLEARRRL